MRGMHNVKNVITILLTIYKDYKDNRKLIKTLTSTIRKTMFTRTLND